MKYILVLVALTLVAIPAARAQAGGQISLLPASPTLVQGDSLKLTAVLTDNGRQRDVTRNVRRWTSSDPSVAAVNADGEVFANGGGSATITALDGNLQSSTVVTVTAPHATLSSSELDFPYQLVGTTSAPVALTITSTGTAPLEIRKIVIREHEDAGDDANASDFIPGLNFSLPASVLPGQSVTLNLTFAPQAPWRPGTRQARLHISTNAGSQRVQLSGMGVSCAGPVFAEASGGLCADTDGDGFNDAWEDNDYIDMNNNGRFDPGVDFAFPHRRPYFFSAVTQTGVGANRVFPTVEDATLPIVPSSVAVTMVSGGDVGTAMFVYTVNDGPIAGPLEARPVMNIGGNLRLMFYGGIAFNAGDTYSFTASMGEETRIADKNVPNIYVQYDYMDFDAPGAACTADPDCDGSGAELNAVCHSGFCNHNHYPGDPLFRKVVDQFAAHGITLYIDPVHGVVPHARVITWSKFTDPLGGGKTACAGADVVDGNIGPGQFAVNFQDVKNRPGSDFARDPFRKTIYHYAVFSHLNTCTNDSPGPGWCRNCFNDRATPSGQPFFGASGTAELPGNDFIVSLGASLNNGGGSVPTDPFLEEGDFMHELGHNLGLHHAGDTGTPTGEPNYLSVMNYNYSLQGIQHAATPGSAIPVEDLREVNYSEHVLNTLQENALDESAGVSPLSSGYTGIVIFYNGQNSYTYAPEAGPIDWSGNGVIDNGLVTADLNQVSSPTEVMTGYRDWDHDAVGGGACTTSADCRINIVRAVLHSQFDPSMDTHEPCLNGRCQSLWFKFQRTPWAIADGPAPNVVHEPGPPAVSARPWSLVSLRMPQVDYSPGRNDIPLTQKEAEAKAKHILLPPRAATMLAPSPCSSSSVVADVTLRLPGADDLDVTQVDIDSLKLSGVSPAKVSVVDVDGDGRPGLDLTFPTASLKPNTKHTILTGSLKNSQAFWAQVEVGCQR